MKTKRILFSLLTVSALAQASYFHPSLNEELKYNTQQIAHYKQAIKKLQKRNEVLKKDKAKNPTLYQEKALFENTKKSYIQRIKLNGSKPEAINFIVKDHRISLSMNVKTEHKEDSNYFFSSRYFSQSFVIPKDVKEDKIKHEVQGDYFTIIMPKDS